MTVIFAFVLTGGIGYAASAVENGTLAVKHLLVAKKKHLAVKSATENHPRPTATGHRENAADDQYGDKVLICHIPPGNPGNAHTIMISASAVPAHLAHGDYLGPCKSSKHKKHKK